MPSRADIARTFDAIAAEFDATRTRPWPETFAFESELPRRGRVLDLGCGNGRNLLALRAEGHVVVGVDASSGLLARAAGRAPGSIVRGDIVSPPFRTSSFDGVHCVAALHHLPSEDERRQALKEAARVLRPEGLLVVSVWALEQERFQAARGEPRRVGKPRTTEVFVPWRRSDGRVIQRFYHLFQEGELEGLVRRSGFAVRRVWREGDNHVALAAKR